MDLHPLVITRPIFPHTKVINLTTIGYHGTHYFHEWLLLHFLTVVITRAEILGYKFILVITGDTLVKLYKTLVVHPT